MKPCPFCLGEVPDAAVKCRHCGEWVEKRPPVSGTPIDELGRAANRWINFKIVMGVVGIILVLLFFFLIWLPGWNRAQREFERPFPGFPSGLQK